jgi:hypothetical protein
MQTTSENTLVEHPQLSEMGAGNGRDISEQTETLENHQATSLEPKRAGPEVIEDAPMSDEDKEKVRRFENMTEKQRQKYDTDMRVLGDKLDTSRSIMQTTSSPLEYAENLITMISARESRNKISLVTDKAAQELSSILGEESSDEFENETGKTGVEKTRRSTIPESIVFPKAIRALLTRIQDDDNMTFTPDTRTQLTSWVESMKRVKKNTKETIGKCKNIMDETVSPLEYTKCLLDTLAAKNKFLDKFKRTFDEETGENTASLIPDITFPEKLKELLQQIIIDKGPTPSTEKKLKPLIVQMKGTAKEYKNKIEEIIKKINKADTILKETTSPLEFAKNVRMWFSARQELIKEIGEPHTPDIKTEKHAIKIIDTKFTHITIPESIPLMLKLLILEINDYGGLTQETQKDLDRMIAEMEKKEQEAEQKKAKEAAQRNDNRYDEIRQESKKRIEFNELLERELGPDTLKMLQAPRDDTDVNFNSAIDDLEEIIRDLQYRYVKSTPEIANPPFKLVLREAIHEWKTDVASAISEELDNTAELSEEEKKTIRVNNETTPFHILLRLRHVDDPKFRYELTERKAGVAPSLLLNFSPFRQINGSART